MATVEANIREIKKAVYGRDVREPIADACEHIRAMDFQKYLPARERETSRVEALAGHQLMSVSTTSYGDDIILVITRREER